ncbi:MAG: 5'/3'-nucleotidase SurE [Cyanobacteria bacterium P01_A01_bin.135]
MTFILTNDDGIDAPGIVALRKALASYGVDQSVTVAPKYPHSGCSHQLTRGLPMTIERRSPTEIALEGTPADCARVAIKALVPEAKWVLSGINAGGNLGADIHVSGTVAAVREGLLHRVPGVAISHYIKEKRPIDWDLAAQMGAQVLARLLDQPQEPGCFWNVNLPHISADDPMPEIVICPVCSQPLPADYMLEQDTIRYVGSYAQRPRDPGADVDLCFSGAIAVSQVRVY